MVQDYDAVEAVGGDFLFEGFDARFVVFEAADFAQVFRGRGWIVRIAVEDCACSGVSETSTTGASFDDGVAGFDAEALEDEGVVWGVDDLGAVV